MRDTGKVKEVGYRNLKGFITADAAISATAIGVSNLQYFDENGAVEINGITYTYDAKDDVLDILTLAAPGLTAAVVVDDEVFYFPYSTEKSAMVDTGDEDWQEATFEHSLQEMLDTGVRDPGQEESVVIDNEGGDWKIVEILGEDVQFNGQHIYGLPDPAAVAIEPPDSSPLITQVVGNQTGLTVVTEPILPTTLLDYFIDGLPVSVDQRSTIINLIADGLDNPLVPDIDYAVTVQAHNSASPSPSASPPVVGRLNPGVTTTMVTAMIQAGGILTGFLEVGSSMRLDPEEGFTITHPDGRVTYMRADGTGSQFVGQAILEAVTVLGNLTILGQSNFLSGLLTLGTGINNPTTMPNVTASGWDSVDNSGDAYGFAPRGLFWDGTQWFYTDHIFEAGNINTINPATGDRAYVADLPANFTGEGGMVKIGSSWYVLGKDWARSQNWYVYVLSTSWVKTGEWLATGSSSNSCAIGVDGSNLLIAKRFASSDVVSVTTYSVAGSSLGEVTCGWWAGQTLTGIHKLPVDSGTARYVFTSLTGTVRVWSTAGVEQIGERWTLAAYPIGGIGHDGTNWFTLEANGVDVNDDHVWKYTNLIVTTGEWAWSQADTDAGGAGTAETMVGPRRQTAPTKRAKWTVSLPSPPNDDGTTDGANAGVIYFSPTIGGTLVQQTVLTTSPWSQEYTAFSAVADPPEGSNGFAARVGALGRIISSGGLIDLNGDDSGLVGPLGWDTDAGPTDYLTGSSVLSMASGWTRVDASTYLERFGMWVQGTAQFTRSGADITVGATGDITNVQIGTLAAGLWPAHSMPAQSAGSGRVAHGFVNAAGELWLGSVGGGSSNIITGNTLQLCFGFYAAP